MIRNILCYAEESARRFPGKTAFADEETACTYDELIKSARAVGTRLGREVTPGKPIPVLMDKGVKAIYAFMGIVSAGCILYSVGSETSDRTSEISVGYITGGSPVDGSSI